MNRPRILRLLRIAASVVCLIVCQLLIALWVRSYQSSDTLLGLKRNTGIGVALVSENGQLVAACNAPISLVHQISEWSSRRVPTTTERRPIKSRWGFGYVDNNREFGLGVPHWFLILLIGTFAAVPWIQWRFSLRTLLVATTLVAVVLGLIVAFR